MYDTHIRSILKGVSWRVIATATTMTVVFVFTGNVTISLGVGIVEATAKLVLYYAHERAWNTAAWGRTTKKKQGANKNTKS